MTSRNESSPQKLIASAIICNSLCDVRSALEKGARVHAGDGMFFANCCRISSLPVIEVIVESANFKSLLPQQHAIFMELGFIVACSNNRLDVVKYLHGSPTYNALLNVPQVLAKGIEAAAKKKHHDVLEYLFLHVDVTPGSYFEKIQKHHNGIVKQFIRPYVLHARLASSLTPRGGCESKESRSPSQVKI